MQDGFAASVLHRINSAAAELMRARHELQALLVAPDWDDHARVSAVAICDDIESLLIGHAWSGGAPDEAIDDVRDWFVDAGREAHRRSIHSASAVLHPVGRSEDMVGPVRADASEAGHAEALLARSVTSAIDADLMELLNQLGVRRTTSPRLAYAALAAGIEGFETRERLFAAWRTLRRRHLDELSDAVDGWLAARLATASVSPGDAQIDSFLNELLQLAIDDSEELAQEFRETYPKASRALDHYAIHARKLMQTTSSTDLGVHLSECFSHATDQFRVSLGISVAFVGRSPYVAQVTHDGTILGEILVELVAPGSPNRTIGMRNTTMSNGVEQHPIAYAQIGIPKSTRRPQQLSVQGAHSLFHEIGHGLHHILARGPVPDLSGMDRLSADRRESMALWCEKLLYRPAVRMPANWKKVKALELRLGLVQRVVISIVERRVWSEGGSVQAEFDELNRKYGVARFCELADILEHFAGGPTTTLDGSYYAYLIGAAASSEYALSAPPTDWFKPSSRTLCPDPRAILNFHKRMQEQ